METGDSRVPGAKLKGVGDGLWVTLDPARPAAVLQQDLTTLFERLQHLAVGSRVVLETGDEKTHAALVEQLGGFLKKRFHVAETGPPQQRRQPSQERIRQRDLDQAWQHYRSDALMMAGRVRSGQKIAARKHLVILGDVNPGGEVVAGGDILVMGRLKGRACAGYPDNEAAIILALNFQPQQVRIGEIIGAGHSDCDLKSAEYAHVESGGIVVDNYLNNNPFGNLGWPIVR